MSGLAVPIPTRKSSGQSQLVLGIYQSADGHFIIDPEQAKVVKSILHERFPKADGILNGAGNAKWHESNMKQILTNEKYIGAALL